MIKKILITLVGLIVLIGAIGGIKALQIGKMIAQGEQFVPPPEPVTTAQVQKESWESRVTAVGSLEAVQGVTVTAELTGKVVEIAFEPGSRVKAGDLLVQQDISVESAQLRAAEASMMLAKSNFDRSRQLLGQKAIAKSEYDNADAQFKEATAQADNIRAVIAKKTIRAPFSGRLGIRHVNLGQIINAGEPIVSLQSLDPIYVNFRLPQQEIARIKTGLSIRLNMEALSDQPVTGKITAISPQVDAATRNIQIQATVANPNEHLRPGMFAEVAVLLPVSDPVLAIPTTAVLYAPYSDSIFVVEDAQNEKNGTSEKRVRQQFVRLGEKRGDFVSILSGAEEGQTIVTTGVFKLRNGQSVVLDNTQAPEFNSAPKPENR